MVCLYSQRVNVKKQLLLQFCGTFLHNMQKIFYQLIIYLTASAFYQAPGGVQFAQIFRKSAAQPLYPPKTAPLGVAAGAPVLHYII